MDAWLVIMLGVRKNINNSLFISMSFSRELPNFIGSHIPMEIFLIYKMGKKQGNRNRVVYIRGGSHTWAFSRGSGTSSGSHPQENALVWELPYNK
jgi:hypothetical protein